MPQRDLVAARLRRQGMDEATIDSLRADRQHAQRLAKLAASASARGAAPLPPGQGGDAAAAPAPAAAPAEVVKYRAIEAFKSDKVSFEKGATVFVVGDVEGNTTVQGVVGGKAGDIPTSKLRKITPELLEEERKQREKEIEEARKAEEENLRKAMEDMKLEKPAGSSAPAPTPGQAKTPEQLAYEAELERKFEEERKELLAEEEKLKAEAARIEAMLAALDEED